MFALFLLSAWVERMAVDVVGQDWPLGCWVFFDLFGGNFEGSLSDPLGLPA